MYISIAVAIMAIPPVAYLAKLLAASATVLYKVGWGDYSLVYMRWSSFLIFVSYTAVAVVVAAICRWFYSNKLSALGLYTGISVLVAAILMAAFSIVGFSA